MPWVKFTDDFDWYPPERNGRYCVAYRAGMSLLVTTPCAIAAVDAGKAAYGDNNKTRTPAAKTRKLVASGAVSDEAGVGSGC